MILSATLKVKNLRKRVALLGVCGRIGKNDTQKQQNTMILTCEELTPKKFKYNSFIDQTELWQQRE